MIKALNTWQANLLCDNNLCLVNGALEIHVVTFYCPLNLIP